MKRDSDFFLNFILPLPPRQNRPSLIDYRIPQNNVIIFDKKKIMYLIKVPIKILAKVYYANLHSPFEG
jgi:hypothetical protein